MPLYLGLDCGTQSLSAIVIDIDGDQRRIVFQHSLNFDRDLPIYGTTAGVRRGDEPRDVWASPMMWADALDRMMATLAISADVDVDEIRGISGSAQQHASVYVNRYAREMWRYLDRARPLAPQLVGAFSRQECPVWIDAGVDDQVRDCYEQHPGVYAATTRIHTVASFLASLLVGADAPIDRGDASATGLLDLGAGDWSPAALEATAPGLRMRLPDVRPSSTIAGTLAPYWRDRYSLPAAPVVVWCGETASTLIGTGVVDEGIVALSLGTSDAVLASAREPRPRAARVLTSPTGMFVSEVRFLNGSLAREFIRFEHGLDWSAFSRLLDETPAGNDGVFMLPWLEDEITPPVWHRGIRRFGFGAGNAALDVRAVVEAQMMAMANHSAAVTSGPTSRVVVTGDGAIDRPILQVAADVFGAELHWLEGGHAACLGAALRAYHADRMAIDHQIAWPEVVRGFTDPEEDDRISPIPANVPLYAVLRKRYADAESLHKEREPIC